MICGIIAKIACFRQAPGYNELHNPPAQFVVQANQSRSQKGRLWLFMAPRLSMRTNFYIDGFNLYYGSLAGTGYKWLDLGAFCQSSFPAPIYVANRVRYFTAKVRARPNDPQQPLRQETLIRALETLPGFEIHYGRYQEKPATLPLEHPPAVGSRFVSVLKSEEKGSDVNLASYLLVDAFRDDFDAAVVVSNDSDLATPVRITRDELHKPVYVLHPCGARRPVSHDLTTAGSGSSKVDASILAACQFPPTLLDAQGRTIRKPTGW